MSVPLPEKSEVKGSIEKSSLNVDQIRYRGLQSLSQLFTFYSIIASVPARDRFYSFSLGLHLVIMMLSLIHI